ncbi:MAG: single-stranded-DNA-specific exonuclease RecJ [Candidatus Babeliaceae bacterium]
MNISGIYYTWQLPLYERAAVSSLVGGTNLSFPIVQALATRGFDTVESIQKFLFSTDDSVAHPSLLKDADKAVDRILYALQHKEKILIAGDYDVDGITSSALLLTCLLPLDAQVNFFLPHRVHDGYGLSVKTVERAARSGYKLIITVDNGITAFDAAQVARQNGIDLIITDHHRPHDAVPEAFAIIDPHQKECAYPYKTFAGVGIGFKLMALLYERLGKQLPTKVYELLLLGTVADVVPLTGENRYWVRYGLQQVNAQDSFSLQVLKQNARFTKKALSALDIGFFLTPQINALGRLEDPRQGVKFLIGDDTRETEQIGKVLSCLNEARKNVERSIFESIDIQIQEGKINPLQDQCIIALSKEWQPGVIGLVASRLVAAYGVPVLLFHETASGIAKGSCRSVASLNMFDALNTMHDILISFGGHAAAAGLSLKIELIPVLKERLKAYIQKQGIVFVAQPTIAVDAQLFMSEAHKKLIADLSHLEPFGCENPQPIFYVQNVSLINDPMLLKEVHIKCHIFAEGTMKPVIFFNKPEVYTLLQEKKHESFDLLVHVKENEWNGRSNVEFQGLDIRVSS